MRNRLAQAILAAARDAGARRTLAALATGDRAATDWLGPAAGPLRRRLRDRARRACAALGPLEPREAADTASRGAAAAPGDPPPLDGALEIAAALFDAGLGFEVHELLEPYWIRADGEEREALQGLIQVAVGYQHLANGNLAGARSLLAEGARRLDGRTVRGRRLQAFAAAVGRDARTPPGRVRPPRFPRGGDEVGR